MRRVYPNRLLVEGKEDKWVIPEFMECFIPWGNDEAKWPVFIKEFGGVEIPLKPGTIEAEIKTAGQKVLGIIIDANDNIQGRWASVRHRCLKTFPDYPETIPPEGLIITNEDGLRLGVWMMPDNRSAGMLETFLAMFVPEEEQPLWAFARDCCTKSREYSSPFKDKHTDKACIHTWLAWQDEPGASFRLAIIMRALKPGSPIADAFVAWFRTLYSL